MATPIFGQSQTAQHFELVKFFRLSGCKFCTLYTRTSLGTGQIVYVNTSWSAENPRTKIRKVKDQKPVALSCPCCVLTNNLTHPLIFWSDYDPLSALARQPEEKTCAKHHDHRVFSQSCLRFRNPKSTGKNCTTKLFPDWLSLCLWSGSSKHTHTHFKHRPPTVPSQDANQYILIIQHNK